MDNSILRLFGVSTKGLAMIAYIIVMAAVFIVTFFVIVQRFYKNLLGDEGYLMNTLPAKTTENLNCKIISGMIWSFVSLVVAAISIFIMACSAELINDIYSSFNEEFFDLFKENAAFVYCIIVLAILAIILQALSNLTMIYSAISIGHLLNKRKILASFGAYIVLYAVVNTILQMLTIIAMKLAHFDQAIDKSIIILLMIIYIIFYLVFFILFYILTTYILKNKLNLE